MLQINLIYTSAHPKVFKSFRLIIIMRYRIFAPHETEFEHVYQRLSDMVEITEDGRKHVCSGPLRNFKHAYSCIADCTSKIGNRPTMPRTILADLGIYRPSEVVVQTDMFRIIVAFPYVDTNSLQGAVHALGREYTGSVCLGQYPVVDNMRDTADCYMWIFIGPDIVKEKVKSIMDECCDGRFAMSSEDHAHGVMF